MFTTHAHTRLPQQSAQHIYTFFLNPTHTRFTTKHSTRLSKIHAHAVLYT
jgi:hypothetical protein